MFIKKFWHSCFVFQTVKSDIQTPFWFKDQLSYVILWEVKPGSFLTLEEGIKKNAVFAQLAKN